MTKVGKCKNKKCNKEFKKWSSTQRCCSPLCERLYTVEKRIQREAAQHRKAELAKAAGTATEKEQVILQDRTKLEEKLEKVTHRLVKLRDWGKPCISCDAPHTPAFEAGHFHSKGAHPIIRHNMKNINGQCRHCNRQLSGNKSGYIQGIKKRYGAQLLTEVLNLTKAPVRLSNWELSQLIRQRESEVKNLEAEIKEITC